MKKRILSIVLAISLVLTLVPTMAFAESGKHTVTVNTGEGGKVSTDGTSWSNSVAVTVNDGETLDGKVQYKADEGYELDSVVPSKIVSAAAGTSHTVLLDADGNVWTAGFHSYGQLGRDGDTSTFAKATKGIAGVRIIAIAAGYNHTVLLDADGNVWTAGSNYLGQLGRDGDTSTFAKATKGIGGVRIIAIAAGSNHTVLLDADGNVWTAGSNNYGQLGRSDSNTSTFTQVTVGDGVKIKAIAAVNSHTILLDADGNVWTAGYNNYGQLGRDENTGTTKPNPTFKQATNGISGVKIIAIAAGYYHTVLLDADGNVWTAGLNDYGQLGRDENTVTTKPNPTFKQGANGISGVKITAIAAGGYHTVLLDANGNVWTAGLNDYGQLGKNENASNNKPNLTFKQVAVGYGVKIKAIAAGGNYTVLLDADGNVWTAGKNKNGQLGRDENKGTDKANPTFKQAAVIPDAITFEELLNTPINNDSVFLVKFKDIQKPVIKGLENGKTYCDAVEFTVTDNDGIASVKANNVELTATNGKYTIEKGAGTVTIVATDKAKNETTITVTVNDGHTFGAWQSGNGQYWKKCQYCGYETAKKDIPTITINGADTVCITQDYKFSFALPEGTTDAESGYEFTYMGGGITLTAENGMYYGVVESQFYDETEISFKLKANAKTIDGFVFYAEKTVAIQNEHAGGEASYFKKAVCKTCNAEYGSLLTDKTAPTGEITIGTNKWNSFLNTITFGLFFKDTQSVTVTATDDSYNHNGYTDDKVVKVEYLLSDKGLNKTDLAGKEFTEYGSAFNISPDNQYVIYARLTDHAGNVTYISSNGIVLDATVPVISGIENGKTYCEAQTVTVTEEYIESVKVNGTAVTLDANNQFILNPAEGTQTIVVTDKAGNETSVTVTVNNGHTDTNKGHDCDFCGTNVGVHADTDSDHNCDYCGEQITTCLDDDKDHLCDICATTLSEHTGGTATCVAKAICEHCGEEYGALDSTNHNLEKISATDATVTETGNTEYWHCLDCGKYFADENGTTEITLDDTVIAKLHPEIIEGKGQSITAGEKKELTFKSNAAFSDFIRVELDGKTLDEKNYTATEGSTIITLKVDYVATLSAGEHTIGIVSESGTAETTFTVNAKAIVNNDKKSPETGNDSETALWLAFLLSCGGVIIVTGAYGKRKKHSR